jgi:formylmethanofuran dehydrogenase subunit E
MTEFTPEELAENKRRVRDLTMRLSSVSESTQQDEIRQARSFLRAAEDGTCSDCKEEKQKRVVYNGRPICGACAESRLKVCLKVGVVPNVR